MRVKVSHGWTTEGPIDVEMPAIRGIRGAMARCIAVTEHGPSIANAEQSNQSCSRNGYTGGGVMAP